MRKAALATILGAMVLTSCGEVILVGAGIVAGGAMGYYAGKEGYMIKVEKETKKAEETKKKE